MSRLFGLLGLLVALAVVGVLAARQLKASHGPAALSSAASGTVAAPDVRTPAQALQVQQQVQNDVNKLMQDRNKQLEQSEQGQGGGKP